MNKLRNTFVLAGLLLLGCIGSLQAQERVLYGSHTLYDDLYNPQRIHFVDTNNYAAIALPGLAGFKLDFGFDGPFYKSIRNTYVDKTDKIDSATIVQGFGKMNTFQVNNITDLLMLKIRTSKKHRGEVSLGLRMHTNAHFDQRTEFLGLTVLGNGPYFGKTMDGFFNTSLAVTNSVQASLGYRTNVTKKLGFGLLASVYKASVYTEANVSNSYYKHDTSDVFNSYIESYMRGSILTSGPLLLDKDSLTKSGYISAHQQEMIDNSLKFKNMGYGLSFGLDYQLTKRFNVTLGVKDLGYFTYNQNAQRYVLDKSIKFSGLRNAQNSDSLQQQQDSLSNAMSSLENYIIDTIQVDKFYRYLPTKVVFGASYKPFGLLQVHGFIHYSVFPTTPVDETKIQYWKDYRSLKNNRVIEYTAIGDLALTPYTHLLVNYTYNTQFGNYAGVELLRRGKRLDFFLGFEQLGFVSDVARAYALEDQYKKYVPVIGSNPGLSFNIGIAFRGYNKPRQRAVVQPKPMRPIMVEEEPERYDLIVDSDNDGILDQYDECPTTKGPSENNGCPYADTDGDGVLDKFDLCPDVKGLKEKGGCPNTDFDNDGVNDEKDQCPDEPGTPELRGCPKKDTIATVQVEVAKDSDGDGIVDLIDKCPEEKGSPENLGCPQLDIEKVLKEDTSKVLIIPIKFESGKAVFSEEFNAPLKSIATYLGNHPEKYLMIIGYTDNSGSKQTNERLSQERAAAVKNFIEQQGIANDRMLVRGLGPANPIANNSDDLGKKANRRVEFSFLTKEKFEAEKSPKKASTKKGGKGKKTKKK